MENPNKLFIQINERGFACGYDCKFKSDDIEYLKKDVLLNWAKEGANHYKKLMKDFPDEIAFSASYGAYNAFIEKIESL